VSESSFFESRDDNEAFKAWRNSAFQDFNRELGPRISKRKTQELLGSFLNKQEGSREELESIFQKFPTSAKDKAINLLNQYSTGLQPSAQPLLETPEQTAAKSNIFLMPEIGSENLSETANKFLTDWLGVKNIENKTMQFAPTVEEESFIGTTHTAPERTGGFLIDANKETPDKPQRFYRELNNLGVTPKEQKTIDSYLMYDPNLRTKTGKFKTAATKDIDSAIQKISNVNTWARFKEKDLPLFRGIVGQTLETPEVGSTFVTERPTSWTPSYGIGKAFAAGASQREKNNENLKHRLYVVTDYADEARDKLLVPGIESEVIAPSKSKFEVTGIGQLKEYLDSSTSDDIELIKLKQLYALDPVSGAIQGGKNLFGKNLAGTAIGASASLLNPEVAEAVKKDRYGEAAGVVARDVVGGALTEAGIKAAAPTVARYAPGLVRAAAPFARFAGPAAIGAALFSQGRPGSVTDVITRKAAENPIPFTPRVNPDPKTDVGRRAGNELLYMFNQLGRGRIPYTAK